MLPPRPLALLPFLASLSTAGCGLDEHGTAPAGGGGSPVGGGGGNGGAPTAGCPPYTPGDALDVCSATYLGGTGADRASAIDIAPDGKLILGGAIAGTDLNLSPTSLPSAGAGAVVRLSPDGRAPLSLTRVGQVVSDLEVRQATGAIAVTGDFGVAVLDPTAAHALWHADGGAVDARVAIGSDGTVAQLASNKARVFDEHGGALAPIDLGPITATDIAVDGARQQVIVTGAKPAMAGPCKAVEIALVRSYGYDGKLRWSAWDFRPEDVGAKSLCAKTSGARVAIGRDGKLYFAGTTSGGDTIFQRTARDFTASAPNVVFDAYNDPSTLKEDTVTYYARLSPDTGAAEIGQFLIARASTNESNAIHPDSITADEHGNIYLGGITTCCIAHRDGSPSNAMTTLRISGQGVGAYTGYEGYVLIAPADLKSRLTWAVWSQKRHAQETTGVAAGHGVAAMASYLEAGDAQDGSLITVRPFQPAPAGDEEAFLAAWSAPSR